MPPSKKGPDSLTLAMCSRAKMEIARRNISRKVLAARMKIAAPELTKILSPDRYNRGSWKVGTVAKVAEGLERSLGWLMTGHDPVQIPAKKQFWNPAIEATERFLRKVEDHDSVAKTGTAVYTVFPLRLIQPDLLLLICKNTFDSFREHRSAAAERFFGLAEAAQRDHQKISPEENPKRRLTFMRTIDVERLIVGKGEYRDRTPEMAKTFLRELREIHVMEHNFRIVFLEPLDVPTELALRLRVCNGITLIGKTLSLRRNRNYEIEILESDDPRLETDIKLFEELKQRSRLKMGPAYILNRIRKFENQLAEWSRDHS